MRRRTAYPILGILLAALLAQVLMLISYHSTGYLIPRKIVREKNVVTNIVPFEQYLLEHYITPFEILMSGQEGLSVYKLSDAQGNSFSNVWKASVDVLKLTASEKVYEIYEYESWNEIIKQPGFLINIGYNCPISLINWISGSTNENKEIQYINKILISPVDENTGDVYIKSGDIIFKYMSVKLGGLLSIKGLEELEVQYKQQQDISYVYLNEVADYENFKGSISADVTVYINDYAPKLKSIRVSGFELLSECMLNLQLEQDIEQLSPLVQDYIEQIKFRLFGMYGDVYKTVIAQNRELTFSDQYNIFSIHADASLSYRYASAFYTPEKGALSTAFSNAASVLSDIMELSNETDHILKLSNIEEDEYSYTFYFMYMSEDMPVLSGNSKHSIVIKAASDRVLSVDAQLYDIEQTSLGDEDFKRYDLRTFNMLAAEGMSLGSIRADYMYLAYSKQQDTVLDPCWVIEQDRLDLIGLQEVLEDGF